MTRDQRWASFQRWRNTLPGKLWADLVLSYAPLLKVRMQRAGNTRPGRYYIAGAPGFWFYIENPMMGRSIRYRGIQ